MIRYRNIDKYRNSEGRRYYTNAIYPQVPEDEDDIYTDPKLRTITKFSSDNIHVSDGKFQGDDDSELAKSLSETKLSDSSSENSDSEVELDSDKD